MILLILVCMGVFKVIKTSITSTRKKNIIDAVVDSQRPMKAIKIAQNPTQQGEKIAEMTMTILKGGNKMKNYFSKMSGAQIVSIIVMFISLILGVIVVFVPELSQYEQYIYAVGAVFGGASFTGAFTTGKNAASVVKNKELSEHKTLIKGYKVRLSALEIKYADVIQAYNDVNELGGELTFEQKTLYNTYATQKASLEKKIADEEAKLEIENSSKEDTKTV